MLNVVFETLVKQHFELTVIYIFGIHKLIINGSMGVQRFKNPVYLQGNSFPCIGIGTDKQNPFA